jgi:hypothetical protein
LWLKLLALAVLAQLGQGLGLNLADALARHAKFLANFFERVRAAVFQAKPHAQDLLLARRQQRQHRFTCSLSSWCVAASSGVSESSSAMKSPS